MTLPATTGLTVLPQAPRELPVVDGPKPALRADAQRNRERVICAAARVVERDGASGLTMEAVAEEAGVGKGTVFRRFGDRSSLLMALVDEEERRLQDAVLSGPPPLGPGAEPLDRLLAFGDARLDHLVRHGELLSAAEERPISATPEQHPVVVASRFHVIHLLRLGGHSQECAAVMSSALLAFLSGAQVHHLVGTEGHDPATLRDAWRALATGAMTSAAPQPA
ncbi:MAG: TetR/AcrR family transcriptional regulator [Solirubrobacteraceae bacterium]